MSSASMFPRISSSECKSFVGARSRGNDVEIDWRSVGEQSSASRGNVALLLWDSDGFAIPFDSWKRMKIHRLAEGWVKPDSRSKYLLFNSWSERSWQEFDLYEFEPSILIPIFQAEDCVQSILFQFINV